MIIQVVLLIHSVMVSHQEQVIVIIHVNILHQKHAIVMVYGVQVHLIKMNIIVRATVHIIDVILLELVMII